MAAVTASGEAQGCPSAARPQLGIPSRTFPVMDALSEKQDLYQSWLTDV